MAEKGKPFTDEEIIKQCLTIFTKYPCPEKKHFMQRTSLSRFIVSRRINHFSYNIKKTLKERLKSCEAFSLALDESTDISEKPNLSFLSELLLLAMMLLKSF